MLQSEGKGAEAVIGNMRNDCNSVRKQRPLL